MYIRANNVFLSSFPAAKAIESFLSEGYKRSAVLPVYIIIFKDAEMVFKRASKLQRTLCNYILKKYINTLTFIL